MSQPKEQLTTSATERPESGESEDPIAALGESFVERIRRGETPSIDEYCKRHPAWTDRIRELLPAMALLERFAPNREDERVVADQPAVEPTLPQLGDYLLLREIGRGGMGVVYEAEQKSLGRHVALKLLPVQGVQDPLSLERFRREARAAARLHHTNIVPVFEVGQFQKVSFYVMQYIQGQGLDALLVELHSRRKQAGSQGAKPPSETTSPTSPLTDSPSLASAFERQPQRYFRGIARLGAQVADALAYAHRRGILHRDIKPSNLLLDEAGIVWVTDFGLAKTDDEGLTQAGDIVGTLRFMAPERFRGEGDRRSDVYALGATLYELLTLEPAFHSPDRLQLIQRISRDLPKPLRRIDPRIPHDLETIVLKALEKEPSARYADAEALAEDLRRFLADRPIAARRTSLLEQTWRWCRRNPAVATLLSTIALILVAVALGAGLLAAQFRKERNDAVEARGQAQSATREARLNEAMALLGEAHGTRLSRRPGQRYATLAAIKRAAQIGRDLEQPLDWFNPLRNEAIAALALPDLYVTQRFDGQKCMAASPDLSRYAKFDEASPIIVCRSSDGGLLHQLPISSRWGDATFSADNRFLAVPLDVPRVSKRVLSIWNLSSVPETECCRLNDTQCMKFVARPEGDLALIARFDGALAVHELPSGKLRKNMEPEVIKSEPNLAAHPAAPLVAMASYFHREVIVRNYESGVEVARIVPEWSGGSFIAWHPSGEYLCVSQSDGDQMTGVYRFNQSAGVFALERSFQCAHGATRLTFNESGDRCYATGWNCEVSLWDFWSGRQIFRTAQIKHSSDLVVDSRTNRLAMAGISEKSSQVGIWSTAEGRECREVVPGPSVRSSASLHPSGRIAAQSSTRGVHLYDLARGVELAELPGKPAIVHFDRHGNLYTNGFSGAYCWPVEFDEVRPERGRVGPPRRLPFQLGDRQIAADHQGGVIVQAMYNGYGMAPHAGGWILHPNSPVPRRVAEKRCIVWASVSPDGRRAAFTVLDGPLLIYDTATGELVATIDRYLGLSRFTEDGRWLIAGAGRSEVIDVTTWQRVTDLGPGDFRDCTSDGTLAVLAVPGGTYRLVTVATGREVARFEDHQQRQSNVQFSLDGTQVLVEASDGIRLWDLRRIRAELAMLGLDWDAPLYSPPAAQALPVAELTVDFGDFTPAPEPE